MVRTAYTYNSLNGYCGNCSIVLSSKIPTMIENKKVITRSLIFLFLSLSIVYALTYQKKESLFKATRDVYISDSVSLWDVQPSWVSISDTQTLDMDESYTSVSLGSTNTKILPGTTEYFGTLDIVNILWEKPEFTLQDSKWNYFAYYGSHLDFVQTIQTLGGNVYEMVTESEILQNQLFGDRVSYINLSMFKDVRVMMVIEIDNDVWLLQIPADKYHYSKDYLRSLFIH